MFHKGNQQKVAQSVWNSSYHRSALYQRTLTALWQPSCAVSRFDQKNIKPNKIKDSDSKGLILITAASRAFLDSIGKTPIGSVTLGFRSHPWTIIWEPAEADWKNNHHKRTKITFPTNTRTTLYLSNRNWWCDSLLLFLYFLYPSLSSSCSTFLFFSSFCPYFYHIKQKKLQMSNEEGCLVSLKLDTPWLTYINGMPACIWRGTMWLGCRGRGVVDFGRWLLGQQALRGGLPMWQLRNWGKGSGTLLLLVDWVVGVKQAVERWLGIDALHPRAECLDGGSWSVVASNCFCISEWLSLSYT